MTVIVGAAIALLILVILTMLIFNSLNKVPEATSCTGVHERAECIPQEDLCGDLGSFTATENDCGEGYKCCIPVGE